MYHFPHNPIQCCLAVMYETLSSSNCTISYKKLDKFMVLFLWPEPYFIYHILSRHYDFQQMIFIAHIFSSLCKAMHIPISLPSRIFASLLKYTITVNPFLTGGLHHSLQNDHDLKVFLLQLGLRHVPEGRVGVNLVGDHQRRDQEETVVACLEAHADVCLVQRDELTWQRP